MVTLQVLAEAVNGRIHAETNQQDVELSEFTADSGSVTPGVLFAAIPGLQVHGAQFVSQAVDNGAVAVVTDERGAELIGDIDLPILVVDLVAERLGEIAAEFYGNPARELRTFGITGTNGKTTTTYMLEQLLTSAGHLTALIGGVELRVGGVHTPTSITTPLPIDIQRMLAQHLSAGGSDAVMEVTSHALVQHRTDPVKFAVAGFTHLSIDHLDYHDSLEDYFNAKAQLFVPERCEAAVIIVDDEHGRAMYERASSNIERVYALAVSSTLPEGVQGWQVNMKSGESAFELIGTDGTQTAHECGLPGEHNIANAALAVAMARVGGVPEASIPREIDPFVPGRMEVISESSPKVIVDFAHNADSLAKALQAVRPLTEGRVIVVTGTAGDRDATKRFAMGEATATYADVVVITDDDPHTEDPQQIRDALIEGTVGLAAEVIEIGDRSEAITEAIMMAGELDTVIIAGRGHWTVQFVGHDLVELDDREVAREALAARASKSE